LPYHCLGYTCSQQDKKGKKHLASTIDDIFTQINNVITCVITTCLGDKSTKETDRAKVVEHWIQVATVCCWMDLGSLPSPYFPVKMGTMVRALVCNISRWFRQPCFMYTSSPQAQYCLPPDALLLESDESCSAYPWDFSMSLEFPNIHIIGLVSDPSIHGISRWELYSELTMSSSTGVSHAQELLFTLCHPVCSSEQEHPPTEEHTKRGLQVGAHLQSVGVTTQW
jgi:hypothetical protein